LPDLNQATFYLAGPEKMVTAMRTLLDSLHVDSDYIKTEEFSGY
jgi:ferredoxin-NADP reductase